MECELPSFAGSNGRKSIIMVQLCMSVGPKMARRPIRGDEMRALRKLQREAPKHHLHLLMSEEHRSHLMGSIGWSSARVKKRDCPFRFMRTCCDIVRDTSSR